MIDLHGLIYAYHSYPALNELVSQRTSASLPFCSRYRLIDFALSSMTNAGVRDVGVIMQRNYQSLLNHVQGAKEWDLNYSSGGLSLLPPYGFYDSDRGEYRGCMEALGAMRNYIRKIRQEDVVLFRGDLAINIDLKKVYDQHIATGAKITAVCTDKSFDTKDDSIRFQPDKDGVFAKNMFFRHGNSKEGLNSTEVYIIKKSLLMEFMDWSQANGRLHFHQDALAHYFKTKGKIGIYIHKGYARRICSVGDFYNSNLDMLYPDLRSELFPKDRPVYTKGRSSVSTYYSESSRVKNSLVADGCFIEGEVENCVIFRGVKIGKGAKIRDSIIFQDTVVGDGVELTCVICDKDVQLSSGLTLTGNRRLPLTVPKGKKL